MPLNDARTLVDPGVEPRQALPARTDDSGLIAGRYRLLRPLGEGGMGSVYLADDLVLVRRVAVKTIRPELSESDEVRARIRRECRMHAAIGVHPHIITLYDTVEENGHIYLVMEYFAGPTLAAHLAEVGADDGLALDQGLEVIRQVLSALACIHDRDIVHRDIKTANILLQQQPDGRLLAKLTDFGIARGEAEPDPQTRLTLFGAQGPGTPAYMAPERIDPAAFGPLRPATDLYAVGIILYELLTGKPPFTGSMTEILSGHLVQPPALNRLPGTVPEALREVLRRALAKQPADRFQDAGAFSRALEAPDGVPDSRSTTPPKTVAPGQDCATLLAVPAPGRDEGTLLDPTLGRSRTGPNRRRPWLWFAAAALAAGLTLVVIRNNRPAAIPTAAEQNRATVEAPASPPVLPLPAEPPPPATALETVDQMRQQRRAEAMTATERSPAETAGQQWQVIDHQSRKIH